jgi:hypothetical protein
VHKAAPAALTAFHDLKISGRASWAGLGDVRPFCLEEFSSGASTALDAQLLVHEFEKEKKKKEEKKNGRNDDVRALHRPKPLFAKLAVCCLTRGRAPVTTGPKKGIPRFGERPTKPHAVATLSTPTIPSSSQSAVIGSTLAWVCLHVCIATIKGCVCDSKMVAGGVRHEDDQRSSAVRAVVIRSCFALRPQLMNCLAIDPF